MSTLRLLGVYHQAVYSEVKRRTLNEEIAKHKATTWKCTLGNLRKCEAYMPAIGMGGKFVFQSEYRRTEILNVALNINIVQASCICKCRNIGINIKRWVVGKDM